MITLTENAVNHIKRSLAKRKSGIGICIGTRRTGCTGFAYTVDYVDQQPEKFILEFDNNGIKVFVHPKAYEYLKGLKLDYVKKGFSEGFEFGNPNEKGKCGCGESVSF